MPAITLRLPHVAPAPCLLAALFIAAPCHAAGPWLVDTGGTDMGMAGAGRAVAAQDAAALAANPASLQALDGNSATAAVVPLALRYRFRGSDGFTAEASNHDAATVLPAAYLAAQRERWTIGLGAYTSFGLTLDSGEDWGGERVVENVGLATYNVGPAVAWSLSDRLSLGGSLVAQWARPELQAAVASDAAYFGPPAGLPDGRVRLSGDDWAPAGQVGVSFEPAAGLRLGAAWTAPVKHSVPLDVDSDGLHPVLATMLPHDGVTRLDFTLPQQVLLGASHVSDRGTTVAWGLNWQDWSQFGDARYRMPGSVAPIFPDGLVDTWGASLGVRRPLADRWAASGGVAYESSPAPDGGLPAYFPAAEQWKIALGVEHELNDAVQLRAVASVILQGDAAVTQHRYPMPLPGVPEFSGTYEDTRVYALALAVDFKP
jgi:long-chain fatty acid transport protein